MRNKQIDKKELIKRIETLDDKISHSEIKKVFKNNFIKPDDEVEKIWRANKGAIWIAFTVAIIFNLCCFLNATRLSFLVLYCFWIVAPLSWFFIEYTYIVKNHYKLKPNVIADIKYTQELATKIWAAIILVLGLVLCYKYNLYLFAEPK